MQKKTLIAEALKYLEKGKSIIPVKKDKKPYLNTWVEYQKRKPTIEEVKKWWAEFPDAQIAIMGLSPIRKFIKIKKQPKWLIKI